MNIQRRLLTVAFGLGLSACGSPPPGPDVVATYRGGAITASDVEARVLALPQNQRRPEDGDFKRWFGEIAEFAAVERLLFADAEAGDYAADPDFEPLWRQQRKQVLGAGYVQTRIPAPEPPDEDSLRRYYEEHVDDFATRGYRHVRHIFRRHQDGTDAMQEAEDLRRRALAGEAFVQLARQYSQSESRHRDGDLGMVQPGQFGPEVDRVVFALEPRTPSAPVNTAEGVHIFWVEAVNEGHRPTFEESRGQIGEILNAERRQEAIAALDLEAELPQDSFVPTREELQAVLEGGDASAVVLRIGDLEVNAGQLMQQLASAGQGRRPTLAAAEDLLTAYENSELLALRAEREGVAAEPAVAEQLEQLERAALINFASQRRFEAYFDDHAADLQRFFEANRPRYSEPLRLRLERLRAPITAEANQHMAMLEQRREALDEGETTLTELAAQVGGEVETLDWLAMPQIAATNPQLANLVPLLAAGRHTPPYRTLDGIEMVRVVEREEPEERVFADVEAAVRRDYVAGHGQQAWRSIMEQMLEENDFELNEAGLDAMDPKKAGGPTG